MTSLPVFSQTFGYPTLLRHIASASAFLCTNLIGGTFDFEEMLRLLSFHTSNILSLDLTEKNVLGYRRSKLSTDVSVGDIF